MTAYYNYLYRTKQLQRIAKKQGMKLSDMDICTMIAEGEKDVSNRSEGSIELWMAQEEYDCLRGRPDYFFVNDLATFKGIYGAKFDASMVNLDKGIKCLSWPKGAQIDGIMAVGVMVTIMTNQQRKQLHDKFSKATGINLGKYSITRAETEGYISIAYASPHTPGMHCRLSVPFDVLAQVMKAETADQMMAALDNHITGIGMAENELNYQRKIAALAIKTLVYAQACPDKVSPGVPDKRAAHKQRINGRILNGIESHDNGAPTIVGYHFRQLRHEKYYKGEHKDKAIGSRWVFVEPYEKGLNANTIK